MIKKLRIKFVLINMVIVTVMMTAIFGFMYYSTSRNLELESTQMMERIARNPVDMSPLGGIISRDNAAPKDEKPDGEIPNEEPPKQPTSEVRLPYFSVRLSEDGERIGTGGSFFDLSDEAILDEIVQTALNYGENSGVIKEYNLRFKRFENTFGESIVFADISSEQNTLNNLVRNLFLIWGAAFVVFLGISMLLARWAVRPVEDAWNQQKRFIADASHELKTPLTVITTNAEMLSSDECTDIDRKTFSGNITSMSVQMRGLVESLLELARMDNEEKKKSHEDINFSEISMNCAMMFEPVFFEKGLSLNYDVEENIWVKGGHDHLSQLVDILLDNASKYSSPNGETRLTLKRGAHNHCILMVSDQGDPIPDEDIKNIFKRFYRADKARAMNHSYGLGLSIASSICDEHGGRIHAESRNGWNTFSVEIPLLAKTL